MVYLLLSIVSSTGIFVTFKLIDRHSVKTLHAIIINYLTAFVLGFFLHLNKDTYTPSEVLPWIWIAGIIGILFILMFFVVAQSTQKTGIAVTTIASKMSVVFPILFSIILEPDDTLSLTKSTGFILALLAVLLTSWKGKTRATSNQFLYLPLVLFVGMGAVDSMVKLAQFRYVDNALTSIFSSITFLISALTGLVIFAFRKEQIRHLISGKTLLYGGMLGIFNFGSIYFLLLTLNRAGKIFAMPESSVIFGLNNLGIVLFSVLIGILAFREKINYINTIGIVLSVITIYLLMQV